MTERRAIAQSPACVCGGEISSLEQNSSGSCFFLRSAPSGCRKRFPPPPVAPVLRSSFQVFLSSTSKGDSSSRLSGALVAGVEGAAFPRGGTPGPGCGVKRTEDKAGGRIRSPGTAGADWRDEPGATLAHAQA